MRRSGKNIHNYVVDSSDDDDDGEEQQDLFADDIVEQERVALVVPATDTSSTSRFSPSGRGSTNGRKLVAAISIVLFGSLLLVGGISWTKKPSFALDDSSAKSKHHYHHQEDSSMDTFPPSLYQPHQQHATPFSCANILPNDMTWKAWLHATSNRPATERCGPRVTDHPTECTCHSPAVPWDKSSSSTTSSSGKSSNPWKQTFQRNKGLVKQALQQEQQRPMDIIFYGDSITEHWWGTDLGKVQGRYKDVAATYLKYFRGNNNAATTTTTTTTLNGLALGIGGDRCPNLLYRIMAGEMPDELLQRAKIVWLLIGTNDFGGEHCSADVVTAGILWITQVIRKQQEAVGNSNAHVVLNSLLPRGRKRLTTTGVQSSSSSSASNLWPQMQAVNHALECYAAGDTSGRVHFFNATSLFTTDDDLFVNMTLMVDALHPNGLGSELWAQAITDYTLNLISSSSSSKDGGAVKKFGKEPSPFEDTSSLETCEENLMDGSTTWENWVKQQGKATDRCPTEFENHNEQPQQQRGKCDCPNPVHAQPRNFPDWDRAHERNVQLVEDQILLTQEDGRPLDFLLLGDSITEFWSGYSMGSKHPKLKNNVRVYQELFRSNTSSVRGLGLGIAGDRVVHLLYRLLNGELPDKLNAPIIWLLIGTNDLPRNRCNAETVTAGILNVVALLRQSKPTAKVVINSILPRDRSPLVSSPTWKLISTVNERLECYAAHRADVYFYNATSIFLTGTGDNIRVDHSIMPDFLHPNAAGYQRWGNEIVKQVLRMPAHGP